MVPLRAAPNQTGKKRKRTLTRRLRDLALLTGLSFWHGFQRFTRGDKLVYAASIAYYALLSLFPFALLSVALLGYVTADADDRAAVLAFVLRYFPTQFDFITAQLGYLQERGLSFGVVGTIGIAWGSLGVFSAISTAVNYAWGVEKTRSFWKHKLFSFLMLSAAGFILLVALLLVSASHVVGATWFAGVLARFPGLAILRSFAVRYGTILLFIVVVGFIFYFVPNARVRFWDVWIGAIVTGVLWKVTLEGFSWYMGDLTRYTRVNGSIAAVIAFLIWVYLQAVILLYGAEFTAAYARLRRGRPEEVPAAPAPRM